MLEFIKKYWIFLIVGVLVVLLTLSRCGGKNTYSSSDTTHKHYIFTDSTYKDTLINRIQYAVKTVEIAKASKARLDSFSQASKSYDSLLSQYNDLKEKHLSYNTNIDTILLPNKGYVALKDIISENSIVSRKPSIFQKQLTITVHDSIVTTITNVVPPNRQVYLGGELTGNKDNYLNGVNAIAMYKDRQDRVFQVKAGLLNYNSQAVPQFGFGMLWKIKAHK